LIGCGAWCGLTVLVVVICVWDSWFFGFLVEVLFLWCGVFCGLCWCLIVVFWFLAGGVFVVGVVFCCVGLGGGCVVVFFFVLGVGWFLCLVVAGFCFGVFVFCVLCWCVWCFVGDFFVVLLFGCYVGGCGVFLLCEFWVL